MTKYDWYDILQGLAIIVAAFSVLFIIGMILQWEWERAGWGVVVCAGSIYGITQLRSGQE